MCTNKTNLDVPPLDIINLTHDKKSAHDSLINIAPKESLLPHH